jgi:hypothetical protein
MMPADATVGAGNSVSWSYNRCGRAVSAPPYGVLVIGTWLDNTDPVSTIGYTTCGSVPLKANWLADVKRYFPPDWKPGNDPNVEGQCFTSALYEARAPIGSLPNCSFIVLKDSDSSWSVAGS